ncbi:MAG: GFA family protein [Pseudomonadales bacterium]
MKDPKLKQYSGGCHCGAVRFAVDAAEPFDIEDCNCSICRKAGALHMIVPSSRFKLIQGQESQSTYTFNSGVAKHHFCTRCGIKSFYIPRSNPDGVSINVRCLDGEPPAMNIVEFDGQNWEQNAHSLTHKSQD